MFDGEPHANTQNVYYVYDGSYIQYDHTIPTSQTVVDKPATKERKRTKKSTAKQVEALHQASQLEQYANQPSWFDPYYLAPNRSAHHAADTTQTQGGARNFLEGYQANSPYQTGTEQDEIVRGTGGWAAEGT